MDSLQRQVVEALRERLTWQVLGATILPEIHADRQALRDWIAIHPEDEGMSDAFEQLSLLQPMLRKPPSTPPHSLQAPGQRAPSPNPGRRGVFMVPFLPDFCGCFACSLRDWEKGSFDCPVSARGEGLDLGSLPSGSCRNQAETKTASFPFSQDWEKGCTRERFAQTFAGLRAGCVT